MSEFCYQRRDAGGGDWEEESETVLRQRLQGYYRDVDLAMTTLQAGNTTLRTPFAFYRAISVNEEKNNG